MGRSDDQIISDTWQVLNAYGAESMIMRVSDVNDTKIRFIPKKRYWYLLPCDISGSSKADFIHKMKKGLVNGSFWNLNTDAITDVLIRLLPDKVPWAKSLPYDMLQPAFGNLGECLCNLLNPDPDPFMDDMTRAMIKKGLSFGGWNGQNIMVQFYGLMIELNFKRDMQIVSNGDNSGKASVCEEIADDFEAGIARLKEFSDEQIRAELVWSDGTNELSEIVIMRDNGVYNVKITQDGRDTAVTDLVDAIIKDEQELAEKNEELQKAADLAETERIGSIIQKSHVYGSILCSYILWIISSSAGEITSRSLVKMVNNQYDLADEYDVLKIVKELLNENVICSVTDGSKQPYYRIADESLANAYIDPASLNYGVNTNYADYTDTDWLVFMEHETGEKHEDQEWVDILLILEHDILMEAHWSEMKELFAFAPENVKFYLAIQISLENNDIRRSLLEKIYG